MRELNVTKTVLDKVVRYVHESHSIRASAIHFVIGELFEPDRKFIQTHWNEISKNTVAENATLFFQHIPAEVQCMACFEKYHPEDKNIHCPHCGSFGAKILSGEEFHVASIETDNE